MGHILLECDALWAKECRVTYQWAMTTIFHDMMHIFFRSYTWEKHLPILDKIFTYLEEFKVRLKPKKCAFGIKSGKLLGYIVSAKGIEVDPKKVQAIVNMQPLKNLSQLHSLQGRLQSVCHFISQLAEKWVPFTHLLHNDIIFKCDDQF